MNQQSRIMAGALIGAISGAVATYLFYTDHGRTLRERMEPAVDDLKREFERFQGTVEKLGAMANEGMRVFNEFNAVRMQSQYPTGRTSH